MGLSDAAIIDQTRHRFPAFQDGTITPVPIAKGGSDRRFVRLISESGTSLICMHYTLERFENTRFEAISRFLSGLEVTVPAIEASNEEDHLLWLQDLGAEDLYSLSRQLPWAEGLKDYYEKALAEVVKIHAATETRWSADPALPELQPGFDRALYDWEHEYFFENFVKHFSACNGSEAEAIRTGRDLEALTQGFLSRSRVLIHRDFQSQNLMVHEGRVFLIDFQGMRFGLPEYDLASLVFDPYVSLSAERRRDLIAVYLEKSRGLVDTGDDPEAFHQRVSLCGAQRLMQALGAYGFIGRVRGKREYFDYIAPAITLLRELIAGNDTLQCLAPLLCLRESHLT